MAINTTMIDRKQYPELDFLLWDNCAPTIAGNEAFQVYDRKWRDVQIDELIDIEKQLIKKLTECYGNGLMLT